MTVSTLRELEHELRRREHDDPLALVYKPYVHQLRLHRSRSSITLGLGANRVGKSWSAVAEALYYCLGRVVYADVPNPPVTVWYTMPSMTMFRRTVRPILNRLIPRSEVRRYNERDGVYYFKNGSELHFVSADMRQKRLQGAEVHLAIMDETPSEDIYNELVARVQTTHGRILIVFAPIPEQISEWSWIRDHLYIPWQAGDRTDVDVIEMALADAEGHSLVPHFTDEDIAQMKRLWPDPATQAARIYGRMVTRVGLVFRNFNPEVHVVRAFEVPEGWARWFICDPEYHRFAVLYFAADEKGNYYITDEYFSQDDALAHRAERMMVIAGRRERDVTCYVDTANPQDTAELNWHFQRIKAPIGALPLPMTKKVEDFVLRTHALMEPSDERKYPPLTGLGDCYGAPRLFLFDTLMSRWKWDERDMQCSRLLWELQRLSWGKNGKPDKDSADGADACDCLIYGCSILAAGTHTLDPDAWLRDLSPRDRLIWEAIERQDRVKRLPQREW